MSPNVDLIMKKKYFHTLSELTHIFQNILNIFCSLNTLKIFKSKFKYLLISTHYNNKSLGSSPIPWNSRLFVQQLVQANIRGNIKAPHSWWRHQMETFSALLAHCAGNSPVTGEFPAQRPVTRSCDVFFDLRLKKRLSKQPWGWWFETPSWSLLRHCNVLALCGGNKPVTGQFPLQMVPLIKDQ